jgi:hypothetical protein
MLIHVFARFVCSFCLRQIFSVHNTLQPVALVCYFILSFYSAEELGSLIYSLFPVNSG